ncbi:hypothetical protein MRB53_030438 [Persea americana]|uniref:Uncharacterized protein n=1 Tax=Persea americana TaxID=3435 RepID=A0ACC2KL85_PERAE|nr:hypothetical protein MRB53_030438 [Persea americana]
MEKVPYMEQLIEYYGGPERVTAKQQNLELERVAKTLPDNVPSSVKRFTDRALLSLQSNPGWGFDKKCQFMDKLVWEIQSKILRHKGSDVILVLLLPVTSWMLPYDASMKQSKIS